MENFLWSLPSVFLKQSVNLKENSGGKKKKKHPAAYIRNDGLQSSHKVKIFYFK